MSRRLIGLTIYYPKTTLVVSFVLTLMFGAQFVKIHIDTDPENMLAADQQDRALYNEVKTTFRIHDLIVFGIVDEAGVFQPKTLEKVARIIDGILEIPGVTTDDIVSLTTTNNVRSQAGLLEVRRIMHQIPQDAAGGEALRTAIADNPLLTDKVASADGTGLAIYVPIASNDQAHRIGSEIKTLAGTELKEGQHVEPQLIHISGNQQRRCLCDSVTSLRVQ